MLNIVNVIYSQTIRENKERERKLRHYPSSACAILDGKFIGKCRKATWFEWMRFKKTNPMDAPALFKTNTGNLLHDQMSGVLTRGLIDLGYQEEDLYGEGKGDEVEFIWQPEGLKYPFSGRKDKRFIGLEGNRLVMEWKSTYGKGTDYIKRDGPKEENLLQCAIYLEQDKWPVDAIALVYVARDSGYIFGFWITKAKSTKSGLLVEHMGSSVANFSGLSWNTILEGTKSLEVALAKDEPPKCDYPASDWHCKYCSYESMCRGRA